MTEVIVHSASQTAEMLGVSKAHVYRLIRSGEIRAVRLGKRVLIPAREIERLING